MPILDSHLKICRGDFLENIYIIKSSYINDYPTRIEENVENDLCQETQNEILRNKKYLNGFETPKLA